MTCTHVSVKNFQQFQRALVPTRTLTQNHRVTWRLEIQTHALTWRVSLGSRRPAGRYQVPARDGFASCIIRTSLLSLITTAHTMYPTVFFVMGTNPSLTEFHQMLISVIACVKANAWHCVRPPKGLEQPAWLGENILSHDEVGCSLLTSQPSAVECHSGRGLVSHQNPQQGGTQEGSERVWAWGIVLRWNNVWPNVLWQVYLSALILDIEIILDKISPFFVWTLHSQEGIFAFLLAHKWQHTGLKNLPHNSMVLWRDTILKSSWCWAEKKLFCAFTITPTCLESASLLLRRKSNAPSTKLTSSRNVNWSFVHRFPL